MKNKTKRKYENALLALSDSLLWTLNHIWNESHSGPMPPGLSECLESIDKLHEELQEKRAKNQKKEFREFRREVVAAIASGDYELEDNQALAALNELAKDIEKAQRISNGRLITKQKVEVSTRVLQTAVKLARQSIKPSRQPMAT